MYLPARTHRVLIMGRNGAVGANHPLATQAGLDTLRAGGNAVDAAVAISLTLGVVEPGMSGLGGDGFYHVHLAKGGASHCYNATGGAARAAREGGCLSGRTPSPTFPRCVAFAHHFIESARTASNSFPA
jgi:gamma-glutamyltranspeptidase